MSPIRFDYQHADFLQLIYRLSQNTTKENVEREAANKAVEISKLFTNEGLIQGSGTHHVPYKKKYSNAILNRDDMTKVNKSTSAIDTALTECEQLLRYFGNITWATASSP